MTDIEGQKKSKVAIKVAENEFERFAESWDLDTETQYMNIEDADKFREYQRKIVRQIQNGRAVINDNNNIEYTLFEAVGNLLKVEIIRPRGAAYLAMDKEKTGRTQGQTINFIASAIGQLPGVVKKMDGIDYKFFQAVYMIFLGS